MSINVVIQNVSAAGDVPPAKKIVSWATAALDKQYRDAELTLRIVDEAEGLELNKTWRNRNYATNVLSFPVGDPIAQVPGLLGDIVICAPVVEREAKTQGKNAEAHWAHLFVHGMLHLQGYDHELETETKVMEALEIIILDKIGYANPYAVELES